MKVSTVIAGAIYATTATAWRINWRFVNGQTLESHGSSTSSPCHNLRINNVNLDYYDVDFATTLVRDPNRVRIWAGTNCGGTLLWDSTREGRNNLVPDRRVTSYKIDHN
jgi:hypothetical protein